MRAVLPAILIGAESFAAPPFSSHANEPQTDTPTSTAHGFRGAHLNERLDGSETPWLVDYAAHRARIRGILDGLVKGAGVNLVDIFVSIPYTLKEPSRAPDPALPLAAWGNTAYLDRVAAFVDDCAAAGVQVEIDLASNLWMPASIDSAQQIAQSGHWPKPDETPWDEAAHWYRGCIEYVEARAAHPEAIALWCMMGNHALGTAEPRLWDLAPGTPEALATETFVKHVWPVFRAAGKRPKAPPVLLPILSSAPYWTAKTPGERLSAFSNMKRWIVDDLKLAPDYWVMSTYPWCDPAQDDFHYLRRIVEILGSDQAGRILSTDLKGPGHEREWVTSIIAPQGRSGVDALAWQVEQSRAYGFAGWWVWAWQDSGEAAWGMTDKDGTWKHERLRALGIGVRE
ncbi:MAG: hypothetical protein HYV27_07555 [Candidatus Hydrogenedentes bacterium]|nr:hypothetical protein [Candidatus Hydrogenedentota bacterium]